MFKKIIWPILSFISIFLLIIFILGFFFSVNIDKGPQKDSIDITKKEGPFLDTNDKSTEDEVDNLNIVILGDSIGFGIGDKSNKGIGLRYKELISKEESKNIKISNFSVPGHESIDLLNLMETSPNDSIISKADIIIISIGGNDLNHMEYENALSLDVNFKEILKSYKSNLQNVINQIREINKEGQLAIIGLYDPYPQEETQKTRLILQWNYETALIANLNYKIAYIPTYELFKYHLDLYLSPDEFHPSDSGYQAISESLYDILNDNY